MVFLNIYFWQNFAKGIKEVFISKAELPQVGIFFRTQFPSLGIFINEKVGNRKTLTTQYTSFKTDTMKVVF